MSVHTGDLQVKGSGKQPAGFSPKVGETSGVYAALSTDDVRAAGPVARHGWLLCLCCLGFGCGLSCSRSLT